MHRRGISLVDQGDVVVTKLFVDVPILCQIALRVCTSSWGHQEEVAETVHTVDRPARAVYVDVVSAFHGQSLTTDMYQD